MTARQTNCATVTLFGIPVGALTIEQALDTVDRVILQRGCLQIGVINAAKVVNMRRNPALRADVLTSDLILADGAAIVWASRLLGQPLPERVAGIDLMMGMFSRGNEKRYRVYFLGASEEVSRKVVEKVGSDYPNLIVAGRHHGYFSETEEPSVIDDIATATPDILLVAMTSPKKEMFLARAMERISVPVSHGVGGSFDVVAGKVRRAPAVWQRLGLEWLYRVLQEPRRLWKRYLVTNTLFIWLVVCELFSRARGAPDPAGKKGIP